MIKIFVSIIFLVHRVPLPFNKTRIQTIVTYFVEIRIQHIIHQMAVRAISLMFQIISRVSDDWLIRC
jgi:hypothetical protein